MKKDFSVYGYNIPYPDEPISCKFYNREAWDARVRDGVRDVLILSGPQSAMGIIALGSVNIGKSPYSRRKLLLTLKR